jgi:uncharacterized glyoxalase superfamily protein PhnB
MAKSVPDGYHTLTPYLTVADGEGMLRFLKDVFGAELRERFNRADGSLKHAELQLGDCRVMVGQANEQFTPRPQTFYVYLDDVDAAFQRALSAGAKSLMPVSNADYGDRTGGFEDPNGNWWWVATHIEDVSAEEIQRRTTERELSQSK